MTSPDLRVRRRALAQGAVWSVPAVAVAAAAPAYAASPCQTRYTYNLVWGTSTWNRTDSRNATATVASTPSGGNPLVVTFSSVSSTSSNVPDSARNLQIPANTGTSTTQDPVVTSLGGRSGERGMRLHHASSTAGRANRQEVTISFNRPVRGLSFWITDIDSITSPAYADRVELTHTPSTATRTQTLDGIQGTGVLGDPWRRRNGTTNNDINENVDENDGGAQVRVVYDSTTDVSSLLWTYWNATGGSQYHRIFIGTMKFTALGC